MSTNELEPKKMDHHEMINSAINDMDSVIKNAEDLLAKIKGDLRTSDESKGDKEAPALLNVLNNAPQMMRAKNEKTHELLNSISESLF